jgi:hypothetical protein
MGMFDAECFVGVARKIDDEHSAAIDDEVGGCVDGPCWIVEEVQNLMHDGNVECGSEHGGCEDVRLPEFSVVDTGSVEVGPSDTEHGWIRIESDDAVRHWGEEFDHPAGSGSDVENVAYSVAVGGEKVDDCRFDQLVGGVECPLSIPPFGHLGEVLVGHFSAALANCCEPCEIGSEYRVVSVESGNQQVYERTSPMRGGFAAVKGEEDVVAFAVPSADLRLDEESEMSGDSGL